jgi:hypothetical protein
MEETLVFIDQHQGWIYFLLAIAGLAYLRLAARWYAELRRAMFGLEREHALDRLKQVGAMLALVAAASAATFVVTTFVSPALPATSGQMAVPTVSLLATPQAPLPATGEGAISATPLPLVELDSSGCQNPHATVTQPRSGDTLSGVVRILGTADIDNFGFYKLEYRSLDGDSPWRAISAWDQPVTEGTLAEWDTSLVLAGDYAFRLVVADTGGDAPLPCVIPVRIVPTVP